MKGKKDTLSATLISAVILISFSCYAPEKTGSCNISFTRVDSLTGEYLELQDSMLQAWNTMINDDNRKLKAMQRLVGELKNSVQYDYETLASLEDRLLHLKHLRFDQCTMADQEVIEEYDFATNLVVSELLSLAESQASFSENYALQQTTEEIRLAEQRIADYRSAYDNIVVRYNLFIEQHKDVIKEIDKNLSNEHKPLFGLGLKD